MAPAAPRDLLDELVHQFTDPFAFYRELIQNSIDAGSSRIEVTLAFQPGAEGGRATAAVADWGEGMTRKVIEDYLLTKFRSSKEDDATKIGKYGIGFVSVFACAPQAVAVDTGRDGEFWRVLFKTDRSYELIRLEGPLDGTRVTVHKALTPGGYVEFAQKSLEAVKRWCRHSEVEVAFAAGAADGSPAPAAVSVREPLAVDAPFHVEHREEGLHLVVGPPRRPPPLTGLYNRGLTLLETHEELVPGVTFKAISRWLEHTLARDDVRRDQHFQKVVKQARTLADGPLLRRLPDELRRCAQDPALAADWAALFDYAAGRLELDRLWLRRPGGGALSGKAVRRFVAGATLLVAPRRTPVVERLDAAGVPVLEGRPEEPRVLAVRALFGAKDAQLADEAWTHAEPVPLERASAFRAALVQALGLLGAPGKAVSVTRVHGGAAELPFALFEGLGKPVRVQRALASPFARGAPGLLCLNTACREVEQLEALFETAPRLAAMLVARRLAVAFGALDASADLALTRWALQ